ncbi:MAG TPA: nucleotidyltransferase domain-containing protein [Bacteroidales bacterium]|nr:nucleotidyltransferase domain-containing protein [Bacteroidales bacterium]HNS45828.1 nucleotidyltransferase domain-containing protein [Bacteroidales bacterium]
MKHSDEHWRWRLHMVEQIAGQMDFDRFGVMGIYVLGSTKNATAGPGSDIDLMIHVQDDPGKMEILRAWIEGWSLCLAEMNFLKTGYKTQGGIIDLHLITDQDIKDRTSFAVRINAVDDPARPVRLRNG